MIRHNLRSFRQLLMSVGISDSVADQMLELRCTTYQSSDAALDRNTPMQCCRGVLQCNSGSEYSGLMLHRSTPILCCIRVLRCNCSSGAPTLMKSCRKLRRLCLVLCEGYMVPIRRRMGYLTHRSSDVGRRRMGYQPSKGSSVGWAIKYSRHS